MASAYDDMLDALEQAVADARAAQGRSDRMEKRSREILETAHDGFVAMDATGVIIDWNAEAERMFGWARDDVVGRSVADTIIPSDLRPAHRAGLERFTATGQGDYVGRTVEVTALRRSGERFPAELTVWATTNDGILTFNAFLRDITDRKSAQEAMGRLAAIVESSDDAILSTSLDGLVLTWNQGAERMYGYTASETIGHDLVALIVPPGANDQVDRSLEAVRLGQTVQRLEVVRRHSSGALLDVGLTISPVLDAAGNVCGASSVGRDITEERWIAAKLDATLAALESALEEAKGRETSTRRFLDDAAHQLRAPITSILASAETLLRGTTEAERDRLLSAVVRQSFRVSRLMAGLLQMARLDQGQAIAAKPCDLVALCQEEADRARRESPDIRISVTTRGDRLVGQPAVDPHAVTDIISNLLDNARRHASAAIEVVVERSDDHVQVEVHDDGPGLPAGMVERAFERFVSLDDKGGSGLGLAIARDLARVHGGDLSYEMGAIVLRLPLEPSVDPAGGHSDEPDLSEQVS
jgi:PAS domain S-box-containing protein